MARLRRESKSVKVQLGGLMLIFNRRFGAFPSQRGTWLFAGYAGKTGAVQRRVDAGVKPQFMRSRWGRVSQVITDSSQRC